MLYQEEQVVSGSLVSISTGFGDFPQEVVLGFVSDFGRSAILLM